LTQLGYRRLRGYLLSLLASCTALSPAIGQKAEPLPAEDLIEARSFAAYSPIEFSPNGKSLSYTVQDPARAKRLTNNKDTFQRAVPPVARGADVVVLRLAEKRVVTVTTGQGDNWLPTWSPDGRSLAFLSSRDGQYAQLWVWDAESGKARLVSDAHVWTNQLQWLSGSDRVLLGVLPRKLRPGEFSTTLANAGLAEPDRSSPPHSSVLVYQSQPRERTNTEPSPPWSLDNDLRDLAVIDVNSGALRRIDEGHRISSFFLSPDGSRVTYTSPQEFAKPGSQQILFSISEVSIATSDSRILADHIALEIGGSAFSWSPDGSRIAYRTGGMEGQGDCFVLDLGTHSSRNITAFKEQHAGYASQAPLWDTRGEYIYFTDAYALWRASLWGSNATKVTEIPGHRIVRVLKKGARALWTPDPGARCVVLAFDDHTKEMAFYEVDLITFRCRLLRTAGQNLMSVAQDFVGAVSKDGRQFAFFSQDAQHDMNIWLAQPDFQNPIQLTHLNPEFDEYEMGMARLIEWRGLDGDLLQGVLLLPSGYQAGKRYPLIVWVYGGESGSDSLYQFGLLPGPFNLQLFATRGSAVFFPDSPQHPGTPMLDLAKTVLPGINRIIEMGIGDPDRIGIAGHSNGGYSVLSLIVQTSRFKAAVDIDGMGDLMGMYGEMDAAGAAFGTSLEQAFDPLGGTPWELRERYIENSPVFYLDRVTTPLLIVQGARDDTVSPFLADEVFVDLRRLGKEAEYTKYIGEGHSPPLWDLPNQLDFCNRMTAWFHRYLRTYN
jgi:dipeptidyl aminopeptidase/acylaminoacyl peptidase